MEIGDEDQTVGQNRNMGLFSKHLALMYQTVLKHFRSTNSWNPHFKKKTTFTIISSLMIMKIIHNSPSVIFIFIFCKEESKGGRERSNRRGGEEKRERQGAGRNVSLLLKV